MENNARPDLSRSQLRALLHYEPATGALRWRKRPETDHFVVGWNKKFAGKIAGTPSGGYVNLTLRGGVWLAHRLIWFYMTGEWPSRDIDHKNRVRSDNRWKNLRLATASQNIHNAPARSNSKSGVKGVYWDVTNKKWKAQICVNGKRISGPRADTLEKAKRQYAALAKQHLGEYARCQ